ncbi:MAG: hypothetical protein ACFE7E_04015 [Candidatus Hodarchaeota archaeon]
MKEYEKGINYLKQTGTNLMLQLPALKLDSKGKAILDSEGKPQFDPKGKPKFVSVGPGFVFFADKPELSRPYKIDVPDGRTFQLSPEFMDVFKIKRESDLMRILRSCSIILTNFTGPLEQDMFGTHVDRLRSWIGKGNWKKGIDGLLAALPIIEILMGSQKPQFDAKEYGDAAIILAVRFGLW